jgi:hypothetical protein
LSGVLQQLDPFDQDGTGADDVELDEGRGARRLEEARRLAGGPFAAAGDGVLEAPRGELVAARDPAPHLEIDAPEGIDRPDLRPVLESMRQRSASASTPAGSARRRRRRAADLGEKSGR